MTIALNQKFQERLENAVKMVGDYGIAYYELGVFGSYARNQHKGTSDIDICVIVEEKPQRNISGALREECELIGVDIVFVTRDYFANSQDRFAKKLRRDYQKYEK